MSWVFRTNASPLFREEGTEGRQCLCDCRGLSASNSHHLLLASACDAHNVKLWRFRIPTDLFESDKVLQKGESLLASVVAHKKEINDLQFAPNDSVSGGGSLASLRLAFLGGTNE